MPTGHTMGRDDLPPAARGALDGVHGRDDAAATAILASIEDAVARMTAQRERAKQAQAAMERAAATLGPALTALVDDVLALGHKIVAWWDGAREAVLPHFHALPEDDQRRVDALERMWAAFRAPEV